ncbi:peroxidase family protein [Haliangium sp.]|uniref:peroxidase family protein n=1 Tax=Haliangium sp. TaxID=2663208 RepID=UPI003D14C807
MHHDQGRFGRLFPNLPGLRLPDEALEALAVTMRESDNAATESKTPAGFTFLGQFIDHDITLDTTSSLDQQIDPTAVRNMRTPSLELDSVYGAGPDANPFLYDQERPGRLLTGTEDNPDDVPRNRQGVALIGDPRNDENGIISQLQLAFLRFHNGVLSLLESGQRFGPRYHEDDFREAQRLVRWHYQWLIVHEFLPTVVDVKMLESIEEDGPSLYCSHTPFIPVEFSVAAYRYGHSQVRGSYRLNDDKVAQLFQPPADALTSFAPVPRENVVDWRYFFVSNSSVKPQRGRRIDTKIVDELYELPFAVPSSLPLRNLKRGQTFSLPSGEAVARRMGVEPIAPEVLGTDLEQHPLWFYLLKEAEISGDDRLGEVGGRIVAETLLGLLRCDPESYLRVAPAWSPTLPARYKDYFGMSDLVAIANEFGR